MIICMHMKAHVVKHTFLEYTLLGITEPIYCVLVVRDPPTNQWIYMGASNHTSLTTGSQCIEAITMCPTPVQGVNYGMWK